LTSTVSFHFTSPQFAFHSGVVVFFKGARLRSDGEESVGELEEGSIDGVLVEGPIEFDAILYQLRLTRRVDGRAYDVGYLPLSGAMSSPQIDAGRIVLEIDVPVVLVIRVEDASGDPVPGAVVGFSMPSITATSEGPVNDRGELTLLGMPGRYSFTLISAGDWRLGHERVSAELDVKAEDQGERLVVLRVPSVRSVR
jgi:hypothetical protein